MSAPRPKFDPNRNLVVARPFTFAGLFYSNGDEFPHAGAPEVSPRMRERQYEARAVNMAEPDSLIQMTGPKGGRYTITTPWFAQPLVIRGKAKADAALAQIRANGPPDGWAMKGPRT